MSGLSVTGSWRIRDGMARNETGQQSSIFVGQSYSTNNYSIEGGLTYTSPNPFNPRASLSEGKDQKVAHAGHTDWTIGKDNFPPCRVYKLQFHGLLHLIRRIVVSLRAGWRER